MRKKIYNKNIISTLRLVGWGIVLSVVLLLTSCDYIKQKISGLTQGDEAGQTDSVTIHAYSNQVRLGSHPDFMAGVEAIHNGGSLPVSVDTSQVDLNHEGDYPVTYSATGSDGHSTTKTVCFKVTDPHRRIIYLTFDDGPSSNTGRILQILKENGVNATFFITAQNPGCFHYITEAYDHGNAIAAHTYSHKFSIYKSMDDFFADMDKIQEVIKKYTGHTTNIIRFPGGSSNMAFVHHNSDPDFMLKLTREVLDRGYQYVDWNADSRDAATQKPTAGYVIRNACHTYGTQLCLLMHDTHAKNATVAALPTIIRFFKNNGYEFRTITSTGYICHHSIHGAPSKVISDHLHSTDITHFPAKNANPANATNTTNIDDAMPATDTSHVSSASHAPHATPAEPVKTLQKDSL